MERRINGYPGQDGWGTSPPSEARQRPGGCLGRSLPGCENSTGCSGWSKQGMQDGTCQARALTFTRLDGSAGSRAPAKSSMGKWAAQKQAALPPHRQRGQSYFMRILRAMARSSSSRSCGRDGCEAGSGARGTGRPLVSPLTWRSCSCWIIFS